MWRIIFVGGMGGMLPSLVDRVQEWNEGVIAIWLRTAPSIWLAVLVAGIPLVMYFVIGAFIAVIYEKEDLQKALLLGVGAPAFIVASVSDVGNQAKPIDVALEAPYRLSLIGSAQAQTGLPVQAGAPQIELDVGKVRGVPGCDTCNVTFFGNDGLPLATKSLSAAPSGTIDVPVGVKVIEFNGADANAATVDLGEVYKFQPPADGKVTLDVGVNRSLQNDFLRSLGAKGVQPYSFEVQIDRR